MQKFIFYLTMLSLVICSSAYGASPIKYPWNNSTPYSFSLQLNSDVSTPTTIPPNTSSSTNNSIQVPVCEDPEESNVQTTFTYSSSSSSNSCKVTVKEQCEDGLLITSSATTSSSGSTATCSMSNNTLHFDLTSSQL